MRTYRPRFKRAKLQGWFRWTPFLAIPFVVIFAEIWMNTHIYQFAYETNALREQMRQANQNIQSLQQKVASMETMDKMRALGPSLGLVQPDYQQIKIVKEQADTRPGAPTSANSDYRVAQANAQSPSPPTKP